MEGQGYGPNNGIRVKISTRNVPPYRDPAVLLIDQLKEIYIDGELELVDTPVWFPRLAKKDFTIGLNLIGSGLDEPDQRSRTTPVTPRATTTAIAALSLTS